MARSVAEGKPRRLAFATVPNEFHVLLVEDDDALASALARALMRELMKVTVARSGEEALAAVSSMLPDILVLDVDLPGIDGFEVLSRLRANGLTLPVMVLTALDGAEDRARSFKLGADVFMGKPVAMRAFIEQMHVLARRVGDANPVRLVYGPLILDREAFRAYLNGSPLDLGRREWSLLEILLTRAGRILSKETIRRDIAGIDDEVSPTAVDVYMSRLRTKLNPAGVHIQSVRGLGYVLPKWDPHASEG